MSVIDDFYSLTKKDLSSFLDSASQFFAGTDYHSLLQLYSGQVKQITATPFVDLQSLSDELKVIFGIFSTFSKSLTNLQYYDLLDVLEEIDNRIKTTYNLNKWSRSSITNVSYSPLGEVNYTLGTNESLERISQDLLGSTNPEDDWFDIAQRNNLIEEDYTSNGGNNIFLPSKPNSSFVFPLTAVVDYIDGKTVYGKDLYKKLTIDYDLQDLKVLDYDSTILQAVDILVSLKKNDNPDFRSSGLQSTLIIGGNRGTLNFPIISRQLQDTIATDDTLINFSITSISTVNTTLNIVYQIQTRLGEVLELESQL
jgi:hypothetical protein